MPLARRLVLFLGFVLAAAPVYGQSRLVRRFAVLGGVRVGSVRSLAQDSAGFIWIGTIGGLLRWDGVEVRRWSPSRLRSWINDLTVCPDGTLYAIEEGGTLYRIAGPEAEPVAGTGTVEAASAGSVQCDTDGTLWVGGQRSVRWRSSSGQWQEAPPAAFAGASPLLINGPPGPGVWVRTDVALWRLEADGTTRRIMTVGRPNGVVVDARGDTLVITSNAGVVAPTGGRVRTVVPPLGRGIAVVRRRGTVWAAFDRWLAAIDSSGRSTVIGSDEIPEGGGPLLVDREGDLWLGTFSGLLQFPEPETVFWNDRHGLPSAHTRYLARSGSRVYVSTWQGLGYVDDLPSGRVAGSLPDEWISRTRLHLDARKTLWIATTGGLREVAGRRALRRRPFVGLEWDIEDDGSGGVWLATNHGILHAPGDGGPIRTVTDSPLPPGAEVRQLLHARDGRFWLAGEETVCRTERPTGRPTGAQWACDSIPGAVEITGLVETPSGSIWAGSSRLGVWRRHHGRWEPHPGNGQLSARAVYGLRPSRDGGIWILGFATPVRVRENLDSPLGWEVLEELTAWHGIPSEGQDVLEDPDGTLWVATSLGLARVPAAARRGPLAAPEPVLIDVLVDGSRVAPDAPVRLRHRHNRLDLRFAALSYRDPTRVRYQVRLTPGGGWIDQTGRPSFSWIDLPAGEYRAEVRASLDGRNWSATPASFSVAVRAPWYLQGWALGLAALAAAALLYLGHRARVAMLLRLERQRTRIAMDLHDELGSGLGSIGILSGVLADRPNTDPEGRSLAGTIGEIASELATSLSDLVWSLRPRAGTLGDVAARLAEHGARLFAGDDIRFTADLPQWAGDVRLDSSGSRSVLLIGLEAMHNAARHAQARQVTLSLGGTPRAWRLVVEDDGAGLPADDRSDGLGRESMRRRARALGGSVIWTAAPDGGTRVTLARGGAP